MGRMNKRKLTSDEIENLIDFIKPSKNYPPETALSIVNKHKNKFRRQLQKVEILSDKIGKLKDELEKQYFHTLIQPGENCGIITAQSIGERQTQASIIGSEKIILKHGQNTSIYKGTIGEFIDGLLNTGTVLEWAQKMTLPRDDPCVKELHETGEDEDDNNYEDNNKSLVMDISDENYEILGVNQDESVSYHKISEISRHPVNGSLLKVKTQLGREVVATPSHSFLRRVALEHFGIVPILGSELKIDDKLPVITNNSPYVFWDKIISIEEIRNPKDKYVYDFTVPDNETFALQSGIIVHNTLSAFHSTGLTIKTVVTGVPRFTELTSVTKKPKVVSCSIFFKNRPENLQELRNMVNHSIAEFTLKSLMIDYEVVEKQNRSWYPIFYKLYKKPPKEFLYCISYTLDPQMLYEYRLPLYKIASILENEYEDIYCIFSPDHLGIIDVFVDTSSISSPSENIGEEDAVNIFLEDVVIPRLESIRLCGISGVNQIYYNISGKEWFIETEGSNFKEILAHPLVDVSRTISDNVWDIYNTLGIEASRQFLIEEFSKVVSSDGTFVNKSHILLLVDIMTFAGALTSVSRYGVKKGTYGPLSRSSFEESLAVFTEAGVYGQKEKTSGISASILLGKLPRIGSGLCDLMVDPNKLGKINEEVEEEVIVEEEN